MDAAAAAQFQAMLTESQRQHAATLAAMTTAMTDDRRAQTRAVETAAATARAGTRKPDPYTKLDAQEWRIWRSNFEIIADINGWGHLRQRREIASSMKGEAKSAVAHIPTGIHADPVLPAAGLLNAYQERFVPPVATDAAKGEVAKAAQRENESLLQWHTRLRMLHERAWPLLTADQMNQREELVKDFIRGLRNRKIIREILAQNPQTYDAVYTSAERFNFIDENIAEQYAPKIAAMAPPQSSSSKHPGGRGRRPLRNAQPNDVCFNCDKQGHFRFYCTKPIRQSTEGSRDRRRPRNQDRRTNDRRDDRRSDDRKRRSGNDGHSAGNKRRKDRGGRIAHIRDESSASDDDVDDDNRGSGN